MQKPSIIQRNPKLSLAAMLCLMLAAVPTAFAGKDDFKQPVLVDSDRQQMDLKSNTTVFDRNVTVVQGTLSITADKLLAKQQDQKGKEIYIATGNPAIYKQTLDDGKPIVAQANEIKYEVETKMLVLRGNALLKQNNSQVAGETIRYDLINQTLEAERSDKQQVKSIFSSDEEEKDPGNPDKEGAQ